MFNHWATGLRSGLLPQDCDVAIPEVVAQISREFCFFVPGDCFLEGFSRFEEFSHMLFYEG